MRLLPHWLAAYWPTASDNEHAPSISDCMCDGNWLSRLLNTNMNLRMASTSSLQVCFTLWIFRTLFCYRLRRCAALQAGRSRIRFPMLSLEFFIDSTSNRNEYQEYFLGCKVSRCVGLTTLPPSCPDCLEIWEPQPPGTLRACPDL